MFQKKKKNEIVKLILNLNKFYIFFNVIKFKPLLGKRI